MRRHVVAAVGLALAVLGSVGPAGPPAHAELLRLTVADQDFHLLPTDDLRLSIGLPAGLDASEVAGATVIVSSHQAIASRAQVTDAIDGSPTRQIDLVRLTGDQAVLQVDGRWQLQVPTETTTRARAALRLPGPGLYPIRIRLEVRGDPVAEVVTFVQQIGRAHV